MILTVISEFLHIKFVNISDFIKANVFCAFKKEQDNKLFEIFKDYFIGNFENLKIKYLKLARKYKYNFLFKRILITFIQTNICRNKLKINYKLINRDTN